MFAWGVMLLFMCSTALGIRDRGDYLIGWSEGDPEGPTKGRGPVRDPDSQRTAQVRTHAPETVVSNKQPWEVLSWEPRIFLWRNFLSDGE